MKIRSEIRAASRQVRDKIEMKRETRENLACAGRTTYVAERRTTRMILLIQGGVKRRWEVHVAQVGQRSCVVAYRYLLSRWLRAWVYAKADKSFPFC